MDNQDQAQSEETQPTETTEVVEQPPTQEAPAEEPAPAPEDEGADEGEGGEGGDDEPKVEAKTDGEKERRRKNGYQRQAAKIDRLERELEELRYARQPPQQPTPQEAQKPPTPEEQLRHFVRTAAREELEAEKQTLRQQETQRAWGNEYQAMAKEMPDLPDVMADARRMPVAPGVQAALLTSTRAPRLMVELARNPDELARLNALPPTRAAVEIGRLEARLAAGAAPPKPKSALRPPAPPTNVGGTTSSTRNLDDLPIAEYKRAHRSKGR